MSKNAVDFPKIIEKARNMMGCSQTEFGELVGIGKTTISNYETGYSIPSWENLERIADAMNISMVELLTFGETYTNVSKLTLPRNMQVTSDRIIPVLTRKMLKLYQKDVPFGGADKFISLPGSMLSGDGEYICFKAIDNSLKGDNISANDYLFVKVKNVACNNDIVVAQNCESDDVIIRKFMREGHIISFIPSRVTEKMSVIRTDERDKEYRIIGIVEKVLSSI